MTAEKWQYRRLIKYVLPSILSMVFISLYTIIDGLFVARFVGVDALASLNLTYPIYNIGFGIVIMLAVGGSALISIALGEKEQEKANNNFSLISLVIVIATTLISIIGLIFLENILRLFGVTDALMKDAKTYASLLLIVMPFLGIKVSFEYFLRVDDCANLSLLLTVVGGLINIILDYIFIAKFHMGILGAGLATMIGIMIPAFIGAYHFIKNSKLIRYQMPKFDGKFLLEASVNGSSEMVTEFSGVITTVLFNRTLLAYAGAKGVAANSIMMYILFIVISITLGISMGIQPVISYNYGAKNHHAIRNVLKKSIVMIGVISVSSFILLQLFGDTFTTIFLKKDLATIQMASNGLRIFAFAFLINGFNILISGYFTSINNGKISAIISFSRSFFILVPSILILPKMFELNGVWSAIPFTEIITWFVVIYFLSKNTITNALFQRSKIA